MWWIVHAGAADPNGSEVVGSPARRRRTGGGRSVQPRDSREAGDFGAHRGGSRLPGLPASGGPVTRGTGVDRPIRTHITRSRKVEVVDYSCVPAKVGHTVPATKELAWSRCCRTPKSGRS